MNKKKKDMAPPNPNWITKVTDAVSGLAGKVVSQSIDEKSKQENSENEDFDNGASGGILPNSITPNISTGVLGYSGLSISGSYNVQGPSFRSLPFVIEPPSGVSEKDIPVIDFRFTTIEKHPLQDGSEKVWTKMEDPKGSLRFIHKITKANLDKLKLSGKLKMNAFDQVCLPHPSDSTLIIFGSDFRDGFVLDDETNQVAYWRIQCKKTGILLEISNY